jgi:hypothetical protein
LKSAELASSANVYLHLENARRHYPELLLLVRNGGSPGFMQLNDLCREYGAEFSAASARAPQRPPGLGDLAVFFHGLLWAHGRRLNILVKMSRRWLPCRNWVPGLLELGMEKAELYLPEAYLHDLALLAHAGARCSVNDAWERRHGFQDRRGDDHPTGNYGNRDFENYVAYQAALSPDT